METETQMQSPTNLRPVTHEDFQLISTLLNFEYFVHRHLDWRTPLDWVGYQPFWLIERKRRTLAALACPPDPPEIAWIRFFATTSSFGPEPAWQLLFERVKETLYSQQRTDIAGLALHEWFARLLQGAGFYHHQDIVVLAWESGAPDFPAPNPDLVIRPMLSDDVPTVQTLDQASFEPLWQISLSTLTRSFQQSNYATVAEINGEIVGYQISTTTAFSAHLARLAVQPGLQRAGIGRALVHDLQQAFNQKRLRFITVNTQSDNHASLALYDKLGFQRTGERFPVYRLPA